MPVPENVCLRFTGRNWSSIGLLELNVRLFTRPGRGMVLPSGRFSDSVSEFGAVDRAGSSGIFAILKIPQQRLDINDMIAHALYVDMLTPGS